MKTVSVALAGLAVLGAPSASAQPLDVDLAALVECRATAATWGELAFAILGDPQAAIDFGWTQVESANPFLQEYDLAQPVVAFGHGTRRIALTATGPMAVLDGVPAADLGAALGVTTVPAAPGQFLGEKVVIDEIDESDGLKTRTRVAINVSTVESHPGKTLAGCAYSIEVIEG